MFFIFIIRTRLAYMYCRKCSSAPRYLLVYPISLMTLRATFIMTLGGSARRIRTPDGAVTARRSGRTCTAARGHMLSSPARHHGESSVARTPTIASVRSREGFWSFKVCWSPCGGVCVGVCVSVRSSSRCVAELTMQQMSHSQIKA